jgi:hypothetical protein
LNILLSYSSDSLSRYGTNVPDAFNTLNTIGYVYIAITYFIFVLIITKIGSKREIGGLSAFLYSTFLTPLAGLFIVLLSASKYTHKPRHRGGRIYKCHNCGFKSRERFDECPDCKTIRKSSGSSRRETHKDLY